MGQKCPGYLNVLYFIRIENNMKLYKILLVVTVTGIRGLLRKLRLIRLIIWEHTRNDTSREKWYKRQLLIVSDKILDKFEYSYLWYARYSDKKSFAQGIN